MANRVDIDVKRWNARVRGWPDGRPVEAAGASTGEGLAEAIAERLGELVGGGGVVSWQPVEAGVGEGSGAWSAADGITGHLAVSFWVSAATMEEAAVKALALFRVVAEGVGASSLEVRDERDVELELGDPSWGADDYVGLAEVAEILGVESAQRADQITHNKDFPDPAKRPKRGRLWSRRAVEAYARTAPRRRGRPPRNKAP